MDPPERPSGHAPKPQDQQLTRRNPLHLPPRSSTHPPPPVITKILPPLTIHVHRNDFKALVQNLTGLRPGERAPQTGDQNRNPIAGFPESIPNEPPEIPLPPIPTSIPPISFINPPDAVGMETDPLNFPPPLPVFSQNMNPSDSSSLDVSDYLDTHDHENQDWNIPK
ncbi:hypothetical protein M569_17482 [Genlisea aurea]|uniref:VQ domain-containing protein n=1 Tax=Genlisea aurea TaxID=192259 RepID=S8BYY5_9LAMI|nr:hypothetical protein M569_17482 [Genlisea aurea]